MNIRNFKMFGYNTYGSSYNISVQPNWQIHSSVVHSLSSFNSHTFTMLCFDYEKDHYAFQYLSVSFFSKFYFVELSCEKDYYVFKHLSDFKFIQEDKLKSIQGRMASATCKKLLCEGLGD